MIVIGGLEGLFVTMIPLRFLDGSTVKSWSFVAWLLVFATVTFLWWQLLFNQNAAYVAAFEQTNVQVVLFTLGVFMLTTGGIWTYFRFRPSPPEAMRASGSRRGRDRDRHGDGHRGLSEPAGRAAYHGGPRSETHMTDPASTTLTAPRLALGDADRRL